MLHYKYLIIGGGMAADAAVRGIRELDVQEQNENLSQAELQFTQLKKNIGLEVRRTFLADERPVGPPAPCHCAVHARRAHAGAWLHRNLRPLSCQFSQHVWYRAVAEV